MANCKSCDNAVETYLYVLIQDAEGKRIHVCLSHAAGDMIKAAQGLTPPLKLFWNAPEGDYLDKAAGKFGFKVNEMASRYGGSPGLQRIEVQDAGEIAEAVAKRGWPVRG